MKTAVCDRARNQEVQLLVQQFVAAESSVNNQAVPCPCHHRVLARYPSHPPKPAPSGIFLFFFRKYDDDHDLFSHFFLKNKGGAHARRRRSYILYYMLTLARRARRQFFRGIHVHTSTSMLVDPSLGVRDPSPQRGWAATSSSCLENRSREGKK